MPFPQLLVGSIFLKFSYSLAPPCPKLFQTSAKWQWQPVSESLSWALEKHPGFRPSLRWHYLNHRPLGSHCFIILCCSLAAPISLSNLVFLVLTVTEPWPEDKYVLGFCFSGGKKKSSLTEYCFSPSRSSYATYQMVSVEAAILPV